jgi:hypothetical protein
MQASAVHLSHIPFEAMSCDNEATYISGSKTSYCFIFVFVGANSVCLCMAKQSLANLPAHSDMILSALAGKKLHFLLPQLYFFIFLKKAVPNIFFNDKKYFPFN